MRSKILVRILIVLLAAFLVLRIHQRVEMYRVPRDLCRAQLSMLADANIEHMYLMNGMPAPDLDSLLTYAEANGFFEADVNGDSILVSFGEGLSRQVAVPDSWRAQWDDRAVMGIQAELDLLTEEHALLTRAISDHETRLGFSLDSLITLREVYIIDNSTAETVTVQDGEELPPPGALFDDSLGFSADSLLQAESELAEEIVRLQSVVEDFGSSIRPARMDSLAALVVAVCPSLWAEGYVDSIYNYDSKLALGTQYSISCPNIERHGGIVGGLAEADFSDTLFVEADWAEIQTIYSFPAYAEMRRTQVSRANLIRAAEEQAAYLGQRYPAVIVPKAPENLDVDIDVLVDPLGGEYVFEIVPDSVYWFFQNPGGRTARLRGDSISVQTYMFVGYTTADPENSRVEVFFSRPLHFPSRAEGAVAGMNDKVTVIMYWDRSEMGSLQIDERDVDLLDEPVWDFLRSTYPENGDTGGD